ncbi:nucleotidyl transferase AbiEii/AbiGii toxin family protein [Pedobacter aquatilis]|uniref:nucleotidyl transferase AbiEii/AbiGii toxin family protein n=1 Tax=Pedobacter aquatilis TaxID=351343 RepID=UPI00292DEB24|nr:nucleotidyl transferase AbiEii/AbiGii toxin family protein [Pedobacter aquatilis]
MTQWLKLTDEQRIITLNQASNESGIIAKSIEKDWWVTLALKALFQTPYADFLIFKGGTSLSKCWKLIDRFSEDIDLALDPQVFAIEYASSPSRGYLHKLKKGGCEFTGNQLLQALREELLNMGLAEGDFVLEAAEVKPEMPDKDPQVIFLRYRSLFDPNPYLPDEVKIEVSVRSKLEPHAAVQIQSLLYEYFPNEAYLEGPFEVTAVKPHKTFLEKAFLLHEEFAKSQRDKIRTERMSRHLYDLEKMMDTAYAVEALSNHDFYYQLIEHRKHYSGLKGIDYAGLAHQEIDFYPPETHIEAYQRDYNTMRELMIYGTSLEPDELFLRIETLRERFKTAKL